jgi:hypothetical protein
MSAKKRLENSMILMSKQFDDYDTLNTLTKGANIDNRRRAVRWMKEVSVFIFLFYNL